MDAKLPLRLRIVLKEILLKRTPNLAGLIDENENAQLNAEHRDELRELVTDEFCATGLRDDYEPNERGLLLEEIIDHLGRL